MDTTTSSRLELPDWVNRKITHTDAEIVELHGEDSLVVAMLRRAQAAEARAEMLETALDSFASRMQDDWGEEYGD